MPHHDFGPPITIGQGDQRRTSDPHDTYDGIRFVVMVAVVCILLAAIFG